MPHKFKIGAVVNYTMRYMKGDFVVTGPGIEPVKFVTRREATNWCAQHYPGSPVKEIGADRVKRSLKGPTRKTE